MVVVHRNLLFAQCLAEVIGGRWLHVSNCEEIEDGELVVVGLGLPGKKTIQIAKGRKAIVLIPQLETTKDKSAVLECVEEKILGYVMENTSVEDLRTAIADVESGKSHVAEDVQQSMLGYLAEFSKAFNWQRSVDVILTARELEILKWIAEDLSNKEIAARIHLSLYTVKNHVHNILEKMQCGNRRHAVVTAINNGWIKPKFE